MHALLVQRDPRKRDCSGTTWDRQSTLKQQPGSKSAASAARQGKRISNGPFYCTEKIESFGARAR